MADQMQTIKRRMKSISSTERITNAMKLVSAARLQQAVNLYDYVRGNLDQIVQIFGNILAGDGNEKNRSIYIEKKEGKMLYVVLAGSKGLCGNYNAAIEKKTMEMVKLQEGRCCFLPIGPKAEELCLRGKLEIVQRETGQSGEVLDYGAAEEICLDILDMYRRGAIVGVGLIRTVYLNSISSEVQIEKLLPIEQAQAGKAADGFLSFAEYEQDKEEFLDGLAEGYLTLRLYNASVEAVLCEHAARRIAMKNASDNAKEMLTELSVYYNRARQAVITSEIIEIISGSEAQRTGGMSIE